MNAEENIKREFGGKQYTKYEALQRQRRLETTMRAQRQQISLLTEGGADEDDIITARGRYRVTSAEYARFSKAMDLPQQRERVTVDGLGNIGVGKWKIDKYAKYRYNKDGTIVVTDDWKSKGKVSTPKKYKPYAVIEYQTAADNGKTQINRSIYNKDAILKKQIHSGGHSNPELHPYGNHSEHAHDFIWVEGKRRPERTTRELTDKERKEHSDIL